MNERLDTTYDVDGTEIFRGDRARVLTIRKDDIVRTIAGIHGPEHRPTVIFTDGLVSTATKIRYVD